ncbi:hypothetical protein C5Y96_02680 [Blastopirellula marina]|uniref:Uncharacterized protein n=1 Tax=Blastopirellula marina TaxID=124 RepID=A0A2S8G2W1_9BACT|nr:MULTISPECIES: hypothetical protein [Pirellulaceae]PQO38792.1 hypothetical protein C5Y96_02680 [Blastopirellula marina]RCS55100.1 hypothetical protein DTL36_02685 [Bremerella cremea]
MSTIPEYSNAGELAWLIERLPEVKTRHPRAEANYYGAASEVAKQLGKPADSIQTGASWLHGWIWDPIQFPEQVTDVKLRWFRHLLARQDQVELLKRSGYTDVHAVGSPYIYASSEETQRRPNSLLVMPYHSLPHTVHDLNEETYADEIAALKSEFDVIVACISGTCLKRGMWKDAFEKQGIPWIRGAKQDDQNALCRMATLFRSFECMTTHTIGSHVAYAGYSGCRVSFHGTYFEPNENVYRYAPDYHGKPQLLAANLHKCSQNFLREQFPQFWAHPREGFSDYHWYANQLGEPNRCSPEELAELLNWSPSLLGFAQIRADWAAKDLKVWMKKIRSRLIGPAASTEKL